MAIWISLILGLLNLLLLWLLKAKASGKSFGNAERKQLQTLLDQMAAVRSAAGSFDLKPIEGEAMQATEMHACLATLTPEERACCATPAEFAKLSWIDAIKIVRKLWPIVTADLAAGKDLFSIFLDIIAALSVTPPAPNGPVAVN